MDRMLESGASLAIDTVELALPPVILMAPIHGTALYHAADVSGIDIYCMMLLINSLLHVCNVHHAMNMTFHRFRYTFVNFYAGGHAKKLLKHILEFD